MIMDSHQWISWQTSGAMNNSDKHNNGKDNLDLTLKLRLPNGDGDQNQEQWFDFIRTMAPHGQTNLSRHDHQIYTQGMNGYYEMGNGGGGQTFHNNANNNPIYVWQPPRIGNNAQYNMQPSYMHAFGSQFSGSLMGVPVSTTFYHPHNNFMMSPNHHIMLPPPPSQAMKDYTLIDHVPVGRSSMRPQRTYFVSNKRCTNYNCNTNNTPMWRKGPLGPKSLCNACGIKYRKDEDKRKAMEAGSCSSSSQDQESNN